MKACWAEVSTHAADDDDVSSVSLNVACELACNRDALSII
jgi:hypothetical protein